jgi:hypothetical protein
MRKFLLLLASGVLLFWSGEALAWARDGHQTVGLIAQELIRGTRAEREVGALLHDGEDMAQAAEWADCAKGYCENPPDEEMREFNRRYFGAGMPGGRYARGKTHQFHFASVPFQQAAYVAGGVGTDPEDVVQVLTEAIRTLRGDAVGRPHDFSRRQALFLVCHLVGDIHQPLHVGAGWVEVDSALVQPSADAVADGLVLESEGGNLLHLSRSRVLHHAWDSDYVVAVMRGYGLHPGRLGKDKLAADREFAATLLEVHPRLAKTPGDVALWPLDWANESLALARDALAPLRLGPVEMYGHGGAEEYGWPVTLPPAYEDDAQAVVELQLWAAGSRLAQVLEAVWP